MYQIMFKQIHIIELILLILTRIHLIHNPDYGFTSGSNTITGNHREHAMKKKKKNFMISTKDPCERSINQHLWLITFLANNLLAIINLI